MILDKWDIKYPTTQVILSATSDLISSFDCDHEVAANGSSNCTLKLGARRCALESEPPVSGSLLWQKEVVFGEAVSVLPCPGLLFIQFYCWLK